MPPALHAALKLDAVSSAGLRQLFFEVRVGDQFAAEARNHRRRSGHAPTSSVRTAPRSMAEVAADMRSLSTLAKADRLDLFLDLHNPGYSAHDIDFYLPPVPLLFPAP